MKILVYGYGNPGRQDDGLGPLLVKELEDWARGNNLGNIHFDSNYQLNIEDAEIISKFDLVIFADASVEDLPGEVTVTALDGQNELSFTSHAASPGYIVYLCKDLFGIQPEAYLVHIKGYQWKFREGLSARASENLEKAVGLLKGLLTEPEKFTSMTKGDFPARPERHFAAPKTCNIKLKT